MNPRVRKAVGGVLMLLFLGVYAMVMTTAAGFLPDNRIIQTIFFVIAGVGWCVPLFPLVYWMENGRLTKPKP